jgi:hypothetical protein
MAEKVIDSGKILQLIYIEKCIYGIALIQLKYNVVVYQN